MPSEITLYSDDGDWKAEVEAWKNNFSFYKSIGTEVTVYHRERTENVWGNAVTDWVKRAADSIYIRNVYSGSGPGTATRERTCDDMSYCEFKEWAVGATVTIPVESLGDVGGGAILDIEQVDSSVSIHIGREELTGEVSASSAVTDNSIW